MSTPWGRDYYGIHFVNLQTREGATMDKMDKIYQVDKMAIMATMAKMAFQLDRSALASLGLLASLWVASTRKGRLCARGRFAAQGNQLGSNF